MTSYGLEQNPYSDELVDQVLMMDVLVGWGEPVAYCQQAWSQLLSSHTGAATVPPVPPVELRQLRSSHPHRRSHPRRRPFRQYRRSRPFPPAPPVLPPAPAAPTPPVAPPAAGSSTVLVVAASSGE